MTGGFTAPAEAEAKQFGIQLWNLEKLVELMLASYVQLTDAVQALVPLRSIWVLDTGSADEDR